MGHQEFTLRRAVQFDNARVCGERDAQERQRYDVNRFPHDEELQRAYEGAFDGTRAVMAAGCAA